MNECPAGLLEVSPAGRPCANNGSGKCCQLSWQAFRQLQASARIRCECRVRVNWRRPATAIAQPVYLQQQNCLPVTSTCRSVPTPDFCLVCASGNADTCPAPPTSGRRVCRAPSHASPCYPPQRRRDRATNRDSGEESGEQHQERGSQSHTQPERLSEDTVARILFA
jgi:hypothetical protein